MLPLKWPSLHQCPLSRSSPEPWYSHYRWEAMLPAYDTSETCCQTFAREDLRRCCSVRMSCVILQTNKPEGEYDCLRSPVRKRVPRHCSWMPSSVSRYPCRNCESWGRQGTCGSCCADTGRTYGTRCSEGWCPRTARSEALEADSHREFGETPEPTGRGPSSASSRIGFQGIGRHANLEQQRCRFSLNISKGCMALHAVMKPSYLEGNCITLCKFEN